MYRNLPGAGALNTIGREAAIPLHFENRQEFRMPLTTFLAFGQPLFAANWTIQEGQGRPMAKGVSTPTPLSDPSPLVFPRNFNRFSAPDANSCAGCHNVPIMGGAGDIVANVFVLGQRFDSRSFRRDRDARRPRRAREFRESARLRQLPRHARHVRGRLVAASGSRDPGRPSEDRKSDPARPDRRSGLEGDRFRKAIP
jgi:hypothetical protein